MTEREIVVDSFAGGGGASKGIEWALRRPVDVAINHDAEAIAMHRMNHPHTRHFTEDVRRLQPRRVTGGRPVGLMWLSPDCKHFSRAKGGKPVSKQIRGLAGVATWWARESPPRVICLENVSEFLTWGPLGPDGRPCPRRSGITFRRWVGRLRNLGYEVEWRSLCAADYGAPTTRRRLFLVARNDSERIRWPSPTHGAGLIPWRAAAECIDWSIPVPSIFDRERPLAENTLRRIAAGVRRFVIEARDPFIVGSAAHSLIHIGNGEREGQRPRTLDIRAPMNTVVAANKFALVSAYLARHYTGVDGIDLRLPVPTITAKDHHSLVTVQLGQEQSEQVHAFLVAYFGNERDGGSLNDPMRTVTARDRFGLVTVHGVDYRIVDIGMRMLQPRELYRGQSFPDSYEIEHGIDDAGNIVALTKTAQVRMCGNSVPPVMSEAIVRAQFDGSADYERDLFSEVAA